MKTLKEFQAEMIVEFITNITVDPDNKLSHSADQNKIALNIVDLAKKVGVQTAMVGAHIRLKGVKKDIKGVLSSVIGKATMGHAVEKDTSTPQIDKMLTKSLRQQKAYNK